MAPNICLALGGGAARGLAHLGVLKVLEDARIPIDMIAGTSAGSLIGGLYALQPDASYWMGRVEQFIRNFRLQKNRFEFFRRLEQTDNKNHNFFSDMANLIRKGYFLGVTATKPAFISEKEYEDLMYPLIPEKNIEEAKIPFGCVAADIRNGRRIIYRSGPIRRAICASCALPGIFPPVTDGDMRLVDGGWVERVPVRCARDMGADIVIAVDVSSDVRRFEDKRGLDVILRSDAVTRIYLNEILISEADVLIHPGVGTTHWADFTDPRDLFRLGETSTLEKLVTIRTAILRASGPVTTRDRILEQVRSIRDRIMNKVSTK